MFLGEAKLSDVVEGEDVSKLLQQFSKVFEEPKGLPLRRTQDHQIPLQQETMLVSLRSYRYPFYKKVRLKNLSKNYWHQG